MTTITLLQQTLRHYWRTNLAVWLGVVVGTAVLGGALLVGDSVRGSLRQMTLDRLGSIGYVLHGPRFFREDLFEDLYKLPDGTQGVVKLVPAIILPATLERREPNSSTAVARAGKISVYGINNRFGANSPQGREADLSTRVADQLGVQAGDELVLIVELPASVPRDSLLGKRDETSVEIPIVVRKILDEDSGLGRMGLQPDQQLPLNMFISLKTLQDRLGLAGGRPVGDPPQPVFARCNAIFASDGGESSSEGPQAPAIAAALTDAIGRAWQPADVDLRVAVYKRRGYFALESRRMILEPAAVAAARDVAAKLGLQQSPVLVYLANEITAGNKDKLSRYSTVAGVDPQLFDAKTPAPFGPFEFVGPPPDRSLGEGELLTGGVGEIIVNDWLAEDLDAKVGDVVRLTYHLVGSHGELPEEARQFKVRGILKLEGTVADDRGFTPEVPGITDVDSFEEWDQPFPMKKVTRRDDEYWPRHRATPKAFVTLKTAQHLWRSRYGELTSLRLAPQEAGLPLEARLLTASAQQFERELLQTLKPRDLGLAFQPVKFQGLQAASGTTDFAGLFLGFSLFLIVSALGLISLLFRLGVERRASQLGLLFATGFSANHVRLLLLAEALLVVLLGGLVGVAAAVGYASLMLYGLRTWWIGAIGTRFLELYVNPLSLAIGVAGSAGIALVVVWWRLRDLAAIPVRSLLAGAIQQPALRTPQSRPIRWSLWIGGGGTTLALLLALGVISGILPGREAFMGISWPTVCFFVAGMAALTAGVAWLAVWTQPDLAGVVRGRGWTGVMRLGLRNAGRHRSRSLLTVGLISTATFLIVAIAAGHRNPAVETPDRHSGNGGFTLVAESSVPVLQNLNRPEGRAAFNLDDAESQAALAALQEVIAFRVNPGENASCLNIYQTSQPTILGVPPEMIRRGGFEFADAREANPWIRLEQPDADGAIPVLGDMNTLQYSLKKGVGSVFEIRDEQNRPAKVKITGMFDGSVFQGVLLMAESHFVKLFPSRGYQYFLLDVGREIDATAQAVQPEGVGDPFVGSVDSEVWGRLQGTTEDGAIRVAADRKWAESILGLTEGSEFTLAIAGEQRPIRVHLAAMIDGLEPPNKFLVAAKNFGTYVSRGGSPKPVAVRVGAPSSVADRVAEALESRIPGFDAEPVADRLANFLAVQNTYLSTFQTLGGLGLLLGTIGLATVMLRNVLERRSELALLRAVGFSTGSIAWLVLAETALLLVWGLASGTVSALIAMSPHLLTTGADFSWLFTGAMLCAVLATGLLAALAAVVEALRTPVLETLRAE